MVDVQFGWSQETAAGGWRKLSCSAHESDDDLRKVLNDWIGDRVKAHRAVGLLQPHWGVVHDVMQTECEFQVLTIGFRFSGTETAAKELKRVTEHRALLISQIAKMLEGDVRDAGTELDYSADARAVGG